MKIKFTRRSSKDNSLVTVSLAQFNSEQAEPTVRVIGDFYWGRVGEEITLVINRVPTLFTLARPNKEGYPTAATTYCFPRNLRLPRVGRPVYAEVSEVR